MGKSKVYFTDMRTVPGKDILTKLEDLVKAAGIEKIDFKNKFTAIKIHFGEPGNLAYIRPNYAKKIVDIIKSLGGSVFLTDANTLYTGRRSNAVDHLDAAMENGFNIISTGANVIIADGIKGTEYREVEIDMKHVKSAKIGSAIADSDIVISMNHFKGHDMTGFGGCLKNLGMGSASRGGKLEMHSASKPEIIKDKCVTCGQCIKSCSSKAIMFKDKKADINYDICIGCGQCVAACQYEAVEVIWDESADTANEKIAEYTYGVLKGKECFHINFIMNVSPNCDCWANNDMAIVPDIGIVASFDPIAIDVASADLVNAAPAISGSVLTDKNYEEGNDKFCHIFHQTNWKVGILHGEKIGLGKVDYELIKI